MRTVDKAFAVVILALLAFAGASAVAGVVIHNPVSVPGAQATVTGPCTPMNPCSDPPSATQNAYQGSFSNEKACTYTIFPVGNGSFWANSCDTGARAYTNTNPFALMNTTAANAQGGTVVVRAGVYASTSGDIYIHASNETWYFETGAILKTAYTGGNPTWAIKSMAALTTYPVIMIDHASWVRITGATFSCSGCVHPSSPTEPLVDAIVVNAGSNIFIDHNWIFNYPRFGVLFDTETFNTYTANHFMNVHVEDNYFQADGSAKDGGAVKVQNGGNVADGGSGVWVQTNVVKNTVGDFGIDFGGCNSCSGGTDWISNVNILYNNMAGPSTAAFNPIFGENYPTRNVNIIGNNITGGDNGMLVYVTGYGYAISDNWVYNSYNMGILVQNAGSSAVTGYDVQVMRNHVYNAGQSQAAGALSGIYLTCASGGGNLNNVQVNENYVTNSYGGYGITVAYAGTPTCSYLNVIGNLLPSNGGGTVTISSSWTNVNNQYNLA